MACSRLFIPPQLFSGNMVSRACVENEGLYDLGPSDVVYAPSLAAGLSPSVIWYEEPVAAGGKRRRERAETALTLTADNSTDGIAEVVVSLPLAACPLHVKSSEPFLAGELRRPNLPSGVTANLPASMGPVVSFVTLAASVPPRSAAHLCRVAHDADEHVGFVFKLSTGGPHSTPSAWDGTVLGFPLDCSSIGTNRSLPGRGGTVLCTQGFGGRGHHRGPAAHHSMDLECPVGTPLLAVFDGVVTALDDSRCVGAPHVDLLPEAGYVRLTRVDGAVSAVYLHVAHGSARVRVGDRVVAGQPLAASGSTGFSDGPHLHLHLEKHAAGAAAAAAVSPSSGGAATAAAAAADPASSLVCSWEDTEAQTVMWALADSTRGAVIPMAGHWYGPDGWVPPVAALDRLRSDLGLCAAERAAAAPLADAGAAATCGPAAAGDIREAVAAALLWCAPLPFEEPARQEGVDSDEDAVALRAFPSLHTCLAANAVAAVSLLLEGRASRFCSLGGVPPVYLACAFNYEREGGSEESGGSGGSSSSRRGALLSMEPAIADHQEAARDEAAAHPEVAFAQDPAFRHDWLGYFRARFSLVQAYELWRGDEFVENVSVPPASLKRGTVCLPVWSLHRCSLAGFEMAAASSASAGGIPAGVVAVFREGPPDCEPFGVWFAWVRVRGALVVADLQNCAVHASLAAAVASLAWAEPARLDEVFYAALKRP